jgi:hypothetical protein
METPKNVDIFFGVSLFSMPPDLRSIQIIRNPGFLVLIDWTIKSILKGGTAMTETAESIAAPPVFQDRKTLLVVFGILQIILGAVCAMLVPFMALSLIMTRSFESSAVPPMNIRMIAPTLLFYLILAVWFIWAGIGSIKARRWARALVLVFSWLWLICGVIGVVLLFFIIPDIFGKMAATGQMPQEIFIVMKIIIDFFTFILFVLVPGMFILVYGGKNVKLTCEFRDPQVRWTDKCPLPVLGLVLMFGFSAFSVLGMLFYGRVVPFFGFLVKGIPGGIIILAIAAILGYLSRGLYLMDIKAWWTAVVFIILASISNIVTFSFSRVSLLDVYAAMDFPAQQIELIKQYGFQDSYIMALSGLWIIPMLGYILFMRKYFVEQK